MYSGIYYSALARRFSRDYTPQQNNLDLDMPNLHRAVIQNCIILTNDAIIEADNVNVTYHGNSALHYAARSQQFDLILALINADIDTTIINENGNTARDLVGNRESQTRFDEIVEGLHRHNIEMRTNAIAELEVLPIELCRIIAETEGGSGAYIDNSSSCWSGCCTIL